MKAKKFASRNKLHEPDSNFRPTWTTHFGNSRSRYRYRARRGSAVSEILDASRGTIDFPAGRDYLSRAIDRRVARLLRINPFVCNVLFVRDLMLLMNGASHCPLCSRALPDLALHESNLRWRKGERANERENVRGYILKRSELT